MVEKDYYENSVFSDKNKDKDFLSDFYDWKSNLKKTISGKNILKFFDEEGLRDLFYEETGKYVKL